MRNYLYLLFVATSYLLSISIALLTFNKVNEHGVSTGGIILVSVCVAAVWSIQLNYTHTYVYEIKKQ